MQAKSFIAVMLLVAALSLGADTPTPRPNEGAAGVRAGLITFHHSCLPADAELAQMKLQTHAALLSHPTRLAKVMKDNLKLRELQVPELRQPEEAAVAFLARSLRVKVVPGTLLISVDVDGDRSHEWGRVVIESVVNSYISELQQITHDRVSNELEHIRKQKERNMRDLLAVRQVLGEARSQLKPTTQPVDIDTEADAGRDSVQVLRQQRDRLYAREDQINDELARLTDELRNAPAELVWTALPR